MTSDIATALRIHGAMTHPGAFTRTGQFGFRALAGLDHSQAAPMWMHQQATQSRMSYHQCEAWAMMDANASRRHEAVRAWRKTNPVLADGWDAWAKAAKEGVL